MRPLRLSVVLLAATVLVPTTVAQTTTIPTKQKPASKISTQSTLPDSETPANPVNVASLPTNETGALRVSEQGNNATPKPVFVTNLPEVQVVEGTVSVGNFPAVQNVAGTLAVGNLPLDAAGGLRVGRAGVSRAVIPALTAPVQMEVSRAENGNWRISPWTSQVIDLGEATAVGILPEVNIYLDGTPTASQISCGFRSIWPEDPSGRRVQTYRQQSSAPSSGSFSTARLADPNTAIGVALGDVFSPQGVVRCESNSYSALFSSVVITIEAVTLYVVR